MDFFRQIAVRISHRKINKELLDWSRSMKKYLLLLIALLGCLCPAYAQTATAPKIVADGFNAYKTGGAAKAVAVWFDGSPLGTSATESSFATYLGSIETSDGKFLGYEYAGSVVLSPSAKYCYVVFLYEKGPLYGWFEVYSAGGKEIITSYSSNPGATQVFPAAVFAKLAKGSAKP